MVPVGLAVPEVSCECGPSAHSLPCLASSRSVLFLEFIHTVVSVLVSFLWLSDPGRADGPHTVHRLLMGICVVSPFWLP